MTSVTAVLLLNRRIDGIDHRYSSPTARLTKGREFITFRAGFRSSGRDFNPSSVAKLGG